MADRGGGRGGAADAEWDAGSGSCGGGGGAARLSGRRQPSWCDREPKSKAVVLSASDAAGMPAAVDEEEEEADEDAAICGAADRRALPTNSTWSSCRARDTHRTKQRRRNVYLKKLKIETKLY